MKKVLSIIVFLLCALSASAIGYASPYKSTGRTGMYMTVPSHHRVSSSFARTPSYTMNSVNSVSSSFSRSAENNNFANTPQVQCFYTSASAIRGGVTSGQTYGQMNAPRRIGGHPGDADEGCPYCHDEDDDGYCDICGCDITLTGESGECACVDESGYCWCPIGDGWQVWLFMIAMAAAYGFVVKRRVKKALL